MKKKMLLALVLIIATSTIYAQRGSKVNWLTFSAKGGYGISAMLNMDTYNDPNISPNYMSGTYFMGARLGVVFGDVIGTALEINSTSFSQEFNMKTSTDILSNKTQINTFDIIGLLRFTTETGFYFEIGPKFSKINKITETPELNMEQQINLDNAYKTNYNSAVLGIGISYPLGERVNLSLGVRANYGFSDIINDNQQYFAVTDDGRYVPTTFYTNPKTNVLQFHGVLELTYFFGYFGKANCGKYGIILFK